MGLLDQYAKFRDYIAANTPRSTRPVAKPGDVLREGLLDPNKFNAPAANRFKDSMFGFLGVIPGADAPVGFAQGADYFNRGEPLAGAVSVASGVLPFIPPTVAGLFAMHKMAGSADAVSPLAKSLKNQQGVIKEIGKIPKNSIFPKSVTPDMVPVGISEMFGTGMSGTIKKMTNGDYLGRYNPAWGQPGKPFYAIGDDADELKRVMLDRMTRSEAGTAASKKAKFNNSMLGKLKKEFGDVFDTARSTQSNSEYITHTPSGLKIRISDHDLPLHYEQPDIDLRSWMSTEDKLAAIRKAIIGE